MSFAKIVFLAEDGQTLGTFEMWVTGLRAPLRGAKNEIFKTFARSRYEIDWKLQKLRSYKKIYSARSALKDYENANIMGKVKKHNHKDIELKSNDSE